MNAGWLDAVVFSKAHALGLSVALQGSSRARERSSSVWRSNSDMFGAAARRSHAQILRKDQYIVRVVCHMVSEIVDMLHSKSRNWDMELLQECPTQVFQKSVPQECFERVSCRSAPKKCLAGFSRKSDSKVCLKRVPVKGRVPLYE